MDFLVGEGEVDNFLLVVEISSVYVENSAEFAVDLDDDGNSVGSEVFVVPSGPFVVGAEALEHFGSEMWSERFQELRENNEVVFGGSLLV